LKIRFGRPAQSGRHAPPAERAAPGNQRHFQIGAAAPKRYFTQRVTSGCCIGRCLPRRWFCARGPLSCGGGSSNLASTQKRDGRPTLATRATGPGTPPQETRTPRPLLQRLHYSGQDCGPSRFGPRSTTVSRGRAENAGSDAPARASSIPTAPVPRRAARTVRAGATAAARPAYARTILGPEEIRSYQIYLAKERTAAVGTRTVAVSALRFLYKVTLKRDWAFEMIPAPKIGTPITRDPQPGRGPATAPICSLFPSPRHLQHDVRNPDAGLVRRFICAPRTSTASA